MHQKKRMIRRLEDILMDCTASPMMEGVDAKPTLVDKKEIAD
jgi:hypothetical protein